QRLRRQARKGLIMAGNFNCVLNEAQFELAFPEQVGNRPTFGFVKDEADWDVKKNDPTLMAPGMPTGIGRLMKFDRFVFTSGKLTMPDGVEVRHWGFEDEHQTRTFPSPSSASWVATSCRRTSRRRR